MSSEIDFLPMPQELLPSESPQIYSHYLDVSTISLANIALAKYWLEYCLQHHEGCRDHTVGTLPLRVLDLKDLACETGRMDQIFQACTLTIYATAGDRANAGLGSDRDPRWIKPCRLHIKASPIHEHEATNRLEFVQVPGGEKTAEPLLRRGWYADTLFSR